MSPTSHLRTFLVCILICSLFVSGLFTTRQSQASNKSLSRSSTPRVNEPSEKTGPQAKTVDKATRSHVSQAYGQLPLVFEENRGQMDREVRYVSRGSGYTLFLTETEAVMALRNRAERENARPARDLSDLPSARVLPQAAGPQAVVLRMKLSGATRSPAITGENELAVKTNYFTGNDPRKWRGGVARYKRVRYAQVYKGIDIVYHGNQRQAGYDFEVSPGADTSRIALEFEGLKGMRIEQRTGELVLETAGVRVRQRRPLAYQEVEGKRKGIKCQYIARGENRVGIEVGEYDRTKPLVIAPTLSCSTDLRGNGQDYGYGIALDAAGHAYVTGSTLSTNFPKPHQSPTSLTTSDLFITKLDTRASGAASLLYSAYLGGSDNDSGTSIAVDSEGNAYVTGYTASSDFPTHNQYQADSAGSQRAFVVKLDTNASGTASLRYSTYLGGDNTSLGTSIAVDAAGHAYVTGTTRSTDFPVKNQLQTDQMGSDAFVTKLDTRASGAASLLYSTYLGGKIDGDSGTGIAVDSEGHAYVTGTTPSADFPLKNQSETFQGNTDAFVTKLDTNRSGADSLLYSTFLGGGDSDRGFGIAVDSEGVAYVTGSTNSNNLPTRNQRQTDQAGYDAFVTKLDTKASGAASLLYSTYLGGKDYDAGLGLAIDSSGNAYVTGTTRSVDFPARNQYRADQLSEGAFVTKLGGSGYYSISGYVFDFYGLPLPNTEVDLYGSDYQITFADYDGFFSFDGLQGSLDYSVAPFSDFYTFQPPYQDFNNLQSDQYVEFYADSYSFHTISGYVTDSDGYGVEGVYMELSGSDYYATYTDYDGYYYFDYLAGGGLYTITPYSDIYTFEPPYQDFDYLASDETADFTATSTATYSISGRVTTDGTTGLHGVPVWLYGNSTNYYVETDSDGNYSFTGLEFGGYYTVMPYDSYLTFIPSERDFNNLQQDQTNADFTTQPATISGHVTKDTAAGAGMPDVTVTLTGDAGFTPRTTITAANGNYSFTNVPVPGNYTLKPSKTNYTFSPTERLLRDVVNDKTQQDFTATHTTYRISGRVTSDGYTGLGYVTMTLTGSTYETVETDSNGNYSFTGLEPGGYYMITPSVSHLTFIPSDQSFSDLQENQTEVNFRKYIPSISGRVTTNNGAGLAGVTVTLASRTGIWWDIVITDSSGNYSFQDDLIPGNYHITASKAGYTFSPPLLIVYGGYDDWYDQDFIGTPRTYAIIGVVRLGAARLPGVTVKLTSPLPAGFPPQTLTTTSGGAYAFDGLPPGRNYKVTATMSGYQIGPAFQAINNLSANQTRVDFNVKINSITGRITRPGTTTGLGGVTVTLASPTPANFPDRTVRTDSTGKYSFKVLPTGRNYTIKPVKSGYTFSPAGRRITNLSTNIPAGTTTNFTGTGP